MKKITIAFDGAHFSPGAFEFACTLNEIEPILLTGVFLPFYNLPGYAPFSYTGVGGEMMVMMEEYNEELVGQTIREFEEACLKHHIEYRVHRELMGFTSPELKKETRYTDLMIIGYENFYGKPGSEHINGYLIKTLHHAECAVILVPEGFTFPEQIVLSFDGSEDAVFAIKSFANLLPELCNLPTTLVYATDDPQPKLPDAAHIKELAARHYSNLTIEVLEADPSRYFGSWTRDIGHPILVTGAFNRSGISRAFSHSFSAETIKEHRIPIFVAHR